jgi:SAM-dependent methyltransferase
LIAGCGSGQHPLGAASKFSNSRVFAVDLSLSSLSHAIRKTRELGVSNIKYMQADILDLGTLKRKFDVIESVGVLHHMADPIAGWKVLADCLKPGGLMKIGLYSELANRSVIEIQGMVSAKGLGGRIEDIRKFRRLAFDQNAENGLGELAAKSQDFYSASACRDLYFHVQAHRFTLPQIKEALGTLGLAFIGFEFFGEGIKNQFKRDHLDPQEVYSLDVWHKFETANPETFSGMYQFWVQKKG